MTFEDRFWERLFGPQDPLTPTEIAIHKAHEWEPVRDVTGRICGWLHLYPDESLTSVLESPAQKQSVSTET